LALAFRSNPTLTNQDKYSGNDVIHVPSIIPFIVEIKIFLVGYITNIMLYIRATHTFTQRYIKFPVIQSLYQLIHGPVHNYSSLKKQNPIVIRNYSTGIMKIQKSLFLPLFIGVH